MVELGWPSTTPAPLPASVKEDINYFLLPLELRETMCK